MDDPNTTSPNQITNDSVNHPSHYTRGDIECIDAIKASMTREAYIGYLKGNCIKYLWRAGLKNDPLEDIRKAGWYQHELEKTLKEADHDYSE